jgi:tRNA (cytidine/uridine-2'-O-)-methyltransferase
METMAKPSSVPGLTLLLHNLRSPVNIGMILRVAETYGVAVAISGSTDVLAAGAQQRTISDFACGALERRGFKAIDGLAHIAGAGHERLLATSIEPAAQPLPQFRFQPGDVVLLGNEYDGLPAEVEARCGATLRIPMADVWTPKPASHQPIDPTRVSPVARDGMPNLNVAIAAGIICYQWFVATGGSPARSG